MNLIEKFKETMVSVLPIMAVVLLLSFTVAHLDGILLLRFVVGGVLMIVGLTFFLLGVDIGILPIGERIGAKLTEKRNLSLLLCVSFVIGILVTVAEPDVQVLANQIKGISSLVNKWVLVFSISIGVGFFVMLGLLRTVVSIRLKYILLVSYVLLFSVAFLCPDFLQGVAFDAGGATTGPMTVPFIMALGMGVANVRTKGANSKTGDDNADSFGLTGIASIGPVAAVCVYGIILSSVARDGTGISAVASSVADSEVQKGLEIFLELFPEVVKEVSIALLPLVAMFIVFQVTLLHMPPFQVRRMVNGVVYSFAGLVVFLAGVNGGFMPCGKKLGEILGTFAAECGGGWTVLVLAVSFVFGAITVCAEPAVWILTEQVEEASGGNIKRKIMLAALSAGVAISIVLTIVRIMSGFSLWWILIPGYAVALLLMFFCPPLFTGIAFDSGGVASGPMTSTFILSFTLGISSSFGNGSAGAFGVIALVAMTPLIAIQILGIIYRIKVKF